MSIPNGLSAFPITPADRAGRVDVGALSHLITRLADVDSIGLLGSTGTYMYLSRDERRRALAAALDAAGRTPIVVGIGALRTDDAVMYAEDARALGAAAGLLAAVSYTPLTEDEVFEHFATVAKSGLPIIIYDNPMMTHFQFTPQLVGRLTKVPGIVAIKSPAVSRDVCAQRLAEQRALVPDNFSVGCSGDMVAAESLIAGADVWYSVLGGLWPDVCLKIVRAAGRQDAVEARRLDAALAPVWDMFKQFGGLRVVYALAELLGTCRAEPPRPILPLPDLAKRQLADIVQRLPAGIAQS